MMKSTQTSLNLLSPASWSEVHYGECYRDALDYHLAPWWPKLFGFHLLKLGRLSAELATHKCAIQHQINLAPQGENIQIYADPHQLPLLNKSIDVCLLAHALNYSPDPHRLLREVDRVIVDDGWLILSNFNPFSLLGMASCIPKLNRRPPYTARMFSSIRLTDWLKLLNYEICEQFSCHILPWNQKNSPHPHLTIFGCFHLIIARKRTIPMTLKPKSPRYTKANWGQPIGAAKSYYHTPLDK